MNDPKCLVATRVILGKLNQIGSKELEFDTNGAASDRRGFSD